MWLTGCVSITTTSRIADPVLEAATQVTPGTATRDTVHQTLGPPLWTSTRWRAELHSGEAVLQEWTHNLLVPIPTGKERTPATLLVVFGPDDVVLGTAYSGPGCGTCGPTGKWGIYKTWNQCPDAEHACVEGDLQGLDIVSYQILLAPAAASRDLVAEAPPSGRCALLVALSDEHLGGFNLYLDDRFLQRHPWTPSAAFVRVDIDAGQHTLACTTWRGQVGPDSLVPAVPAHEWPGGEPRRGQRLVIGCPADGQALYRLVNTGGEGVWRMPACGIAPVDATAFAAAMSGARLVVVPDRPE
jgi:hypothetical protein